MFTINIYSSFMEKLNTPKNNIFRLINAIHYSEHDLSLDHDKVLQEVIDSRIKPRNSTHKSRPQQDEVDGQHTFYEDTNLYDETYKVMEKAVDEVLNNIFGVNTFQAEEIWGHIIPPNEQTMIHNHDNSIIDNDVSLSWVYYPHASKLAGDICFLSSINGKQHFVNAPQQKGKLFIFSSDMMHFTPRNGSGIDRISISGNHIATTKMKYQLIEDQYYQNPYWMYTGRR